MSGFHLLEQQATWKTALAALATVACITGSIWIAEEHYAKASDFKQFQQRQEHFLNEIRQETKDSLTSFRKNMLEDQLFGLELKQNNGTATSIEKALIERIRRQLRDLQ